MIRMSEPQLRLVAELDVRGNDVPPPPPPKVPQQQVVSPTFSQDQFMIQDDSRNVRPRTSYQLDDQMDIQDPNAMGSGIHRSEYF